MDIDIREITKDATKEVLNELKDKVLEIIKEDITAAVKEAKDDFIAELKEEINSTSSVWVKVRNTLIIAAVNVNGAICSRIVDKLVSASDSGEEIEETESAAEPDIAESKTEAE